MLSKKRTVFMVAALGLAFGGAQTQAAPIVIGGVLAKAAATADVSFVSDRHHRKHPYRQPYPYQYPPEAYEGFTNPSAPIPHGPFAYGYRDPGYAYHGNVNGCVVDLGYGRYESCNVGP